MGESRASMIVGAALVVTGLLFLGLNLGFLSGLAEMIWFFMFGAAALGFLFTFITRAEHWWTAIPGFTLAGLAVLIGFGDRLGAAGGAAFLGAIGLSFWLIYLRQRDFWWAVIPAGALTTLALVALLAERLSGELAGSLFFLGLAATFGLVFLLPTPQGRMRWAVFPAGVLGGVGLLLVLFTGGVANYLVPAAMILGGGILVARILFTRR